jgi:hypothetical protein
MGYPPKLTVEQAREVRRAELRYGDLKRLAQQLGVHPETLRRVRRRITYRQVRI